jgi:hypothetical protein
MDIVLPFKKVMYLVLLSNLLFVAACASSEPWWKGKPYSQMTPAEREEQDPTFWKMYGHLHGLGE